VNPLTNTNIDFQTAEEAMGACDRLLVEEGWVLA